MNEREALLRAVCENPDEDTPRLVFADWLQENGEEARAEFIRVQVELARGHHPPSVEAQLRRRERKLNVQASGWNREVAGTTYATFYRGFIEHATFQSASDFVRALGRTPLRIVFVYGPVDLLAVMNLSHVHLIAHLDLKNATIGKADVETFAEGNWPRHPKLLVLHLDCAPAELRARIASRFGSWVSFRDR